MFLTPFFIISSFCYIFHNSLGYHNEELPKKEKPPLTGGIAKNIGVVQRLEKELGITALRSEYDSQVAGAIGAALFAKSLVEQQRKKG